MEGKIQPKLSSYRIEISLFIYFLVSLLKSGSYMLTL